jgi:hypothetical protein
MSGKIPRFIGNLGSGEIVIDRPGSSHVQSHQLPDGVLARALAKIDSGKKDRIVEQVDFPEVIGMSTCVETTSDDDIVYARRHNRGGMTRFVRGRQAKPSQSVVVILHKWGRIDGVVAYSAITAYVGTKGLPEPGDWHAMSREPNALQAALQAQEFWSKHALVWGCEPVHPRSITRECPWNDYA